MFRGPVEIGKDHFAINGRGGVRPGLAIEVTDARPSIAAVVDSASRVSTAKLDRAAEISAGVLVFRKLVAVLYPMVVQSKRPS